MDKMVRPPDPIVDYKTKYSGITAEKMKGVTMTLEEAQQEFLSIIRRSTIIVGHSLENDFKAMRFVHPWVIDTTILYPHESGLPLKMGLKKLVEVYLGGTMDRKFGHDSYEDAK